MARKKKNIEVNDSTPEWVYCPTDEAKERPRRLLKRNIAIGGEITIKGKVVREATQAEYRELYEAGGHDKLIQKKKA